MQSCIHAFVSRISAFVLISLGIVTASSAASAAVIFSEVYNASRLLGGIGSGVTLSGDRAGTVSGSTISFGTSQGNLFGANILDIPITSTGGFSESQIYTVSVSVTGAEPIGNADQDPTITLQAGPSGNQEFMAVILSNDPEGVENRRTIVRTNPTMNTSGSIDLYDQSTGTPTVFPASDHDVSSFAFTVGAIDGVTLLTPTASGFIPQSSFDVSAGLALRIFGHNETEQYTFDSISIIVETTEVSVRGMSALFPIGILFILFIRRKNSGSLCRPVRIT